MARTNKTASRNVTRNAKVAKKVAAKPVAKKTTKKVAAKSESLKIVELHTAENAPFLKVGRCANGFHALKVSTLALKYKAAHDAQVSAEGLLELAGSVIFKDKINVPRGWAKTHVAGLFTRIEHDGDDTWIAFRFGRHGYIAFTSEDKARETIESFDAWVKDLAAHRAEWTTKLAA